MPFIGSMFILVILVLLAMISFAVLALTSSAADLRYSETAASWVREYYRLEAAANESLMRADEILRGASYDEARTLLEAEGWTVDEDTASRDITLDNGTGQNLNVEFVITLSNGETNYEITSWRQWQNKFEYNTGGMLIWPGN